MSSIADKLLALGACLRSVEWSLRYNDPATAWRECERGDWMLWLLARISGPPESESRRAVVLCACSCARLALVHAPPGEESPRVAIETAERWARGDDDVTLDDVCAAFNAVVAALDVWGDNPAIEASASAAVVAAHDEVAASYNAYEDVVYTASAVSRSGLNGRRMCADIVREHYPTPPELP